MAFLNDKNLAQDSGAEDPDADTSKRVQNLARAMPRIQIDGTLAELLQLSFATLPRLFESPNDNVVIRSALNAQLVSDFSARYLTPDSQLAPDVQSIPASLHEKWDRYLINEAATQRGADILLSDHAIARIWAWTHGEALGLMKLERLFKKMKKAAHVRLRGKGSITDQDRHAMPDFVLELTELQTRLRQEWPESAKEIRAFIEKQIEASPKLWRLKRNAPQLRALLADDRIAVAFRGDNAEEIRLTPTNFFIFWLSKSKNRSRESTRQDLYKGGDRSMSRV